VDSHRRVHRRAAAHPDLINKPGSGDESARALATSIDEYHRRREHHGVTMNTNPRRFVLIFNAAFVLISNAGQQHRPRLDSERLTLMSGRRS
jgi:hypothetical protein